MKKNSTKTNKELLSLIKDLKELAYKEKVKIWKVVAKELEKPTRKMRVVNLTRINKVKDAKSVIVPGKVLGVGELKNKIPVIAFKFSESARKKIGTFLTIRELMKKNPKGKGVRIVG